MERLRRNYDIDVRYVYFPLHPETPAEGRSLYDLFGPGANLAAMHGRLKKLMDQEGLPFAEDRDMTYNSRLAQELAKWGERFPQSEALNHALYEAYFVHSRDIGDTAVLLDIAGGVGLPVEEARQVLTERLMQAAVDEDWRYARSIGVTAVPTFAVGMRGVVGAQPYEQLARLVESVGGQKRERKNS